VFFLKCSLPQPNWATANICSKVAAFFIMFIVSARIWNKLKTVHIYFQEISIHGNRKYVVLQMCATEKKAKLEKLMATLYTLGGV
jgi:hypothetical protein